MDITACVADATAFLASLGMPLQTPPAFDAVPIITVVVDGKRATLLSKYENGVVTYDFRRADCGVIAHELVHHRQWERDGSAKDYEEWDRREAEAHKVEIAFRERDQ